MMIATSAHQRAQHGFLLTSVDNAHFAQGALCAPSSLPEDDLSLGVGLEPGSEFDESNYSIYSHIPSTGSGGWFM